MTPRPDHQVVSDPSVQEAAKAAGKDGGWLGPLASAFETVLKVRGLKHISYKRAQGRGLMYVSCHRARGAQAIPGLLCIRFAVTRSGIPAGCALAEARWTTVPPDAVWGSGQASHALPLRPTPAPALSQSATRLWSCAQNNHCLVVQVYCHHPISPLGNSKKAAARGWMPGVLPTSAVSERH